MLYPMMFRCDKARLLCVYFVGVLVGPLQVFRVCTLRAALYCCWGPGRRHQTCPNGRNHKHHAEFAWGGEVAVMRVL
jgi:hypothetical protein